MKLEHEIDDIYIFNYAIYLKEESKIYLIGQLYDCLNVEDYSTINVEIEGRQITEIHKVTFEYANYIFSQRVHEINIPDDIEKTRCLAFNNK